MNALPNLATPPPQPWYRHRWPWILMAGPALVIVAGAVTIWLAISSNDGLVSDDYYKQGLAINQSLARGELAQRMALSAQARFTAEGVEVRLWSGSGALLPARLRLTLAHPTRAGFDQSLLLEQAAGAAAAVYHAPLAVALAGRWKVRLSDEADTWRLAASLNLPQETVVSFPGSLPDLKNRSEK